MVKCLESPAASGWRRDPEGLSGSLRLCRDSRERVKAISNRPGLKGYLVEPVISRRGSVFGEIELPLLNHVHGLDVRNDGASTTKRLEFRHRSHEAFDGESWPR